MNVFLGDVVTLRNESHDDEFPTFVTGQIKGIVLNESKQVQTIYIHNMSNGFTMASGWKFVQHDEEVEEDD